MRSCLVTILLILTIGLYGQQYEFNRLIQYEKDGVEQIQIYYNIHNIDYYLLLEGEKGNLSAKLIDRGSEMLHNFAVEPLQKVNGLIYSFQYTQSDKFSNNTTTNNNLDYTFELKRDDNYYRFGKLNIMDSISPEVPVVSADLVLRYTHEDLFPVFNYCCLLGYGHYDKIKFDDKFVVVKAAIVDDEGKEHLFKLIDDQVIQLLLNVPNGK